MNPIAGPALEPLLRRLRETPPDVLDPPWRAGKGRVHVAAVVHDVFLLRDPVAPPALLARFAGEARDVDANTLSLAAVVAWLLADDAWQAGGVDAGSLAPLFADAVPALAAAAPVARYVDEPERQEELVRTVIARTGRVPDGETAAQAADRLASVSGVERRRLLDASRAAEERARAIREALAKKAAEESADKWTRE